MPASSQSSSTQATKNVKQLFDLHGRVALITGGSIGLGRQMAEGLAEMGASVALAARKGGVISFTKDLACKWARHNIQVNAIAPGWRWLGLVRTTDR